MKTRVFAIEGLHRAGKGTNSRLLRDRLTAQEKYAVQIIKGDGSRPGRGTTHFYDPVSNFWQNWQSMPEKTYDDWHRASAILGSENAAFIKKTEYMAEHQAQLVIMDRCFVSRHYLNLLSGQETHILEERAKASVQPEMVYILQAPKETLLSRANDDNPLKAKFRRQNIERGYETWQRTVDQTVRELGYEQVEVLDATKPIGEVFEKIWTSVSRKIQ